MRQNIGLKVLSLILAILIWMQMQLLSEHRTIVSFRVNLENLPEEVTLADLPDKIPFHISGRGYDILRLHMASPRIEINAANIRPGANKLSLDDYSIKNVPEDISIVVLGPALEGNLAVHTDVVQQKTFAILPRFADEATRKMFNELRFIMRPERVSVTGPRTEVNKIKNIYTLPISSGMLSGDTFEIQAVSPDPSINIIDNKISFSRVREQVASRIMENIPIRGGGTKSYFPSAVTIKVEGVPATVNSLSPSDLIVTASATADDKGWYTISVEVPPGITSHAVTPQKVRTDR